MKIDVQLGLTRVRSMSYAAPDGLSDFGRKSVTPKHTSVSMKDDFGLGEDESSPNKLTNFDTIFNLPITSRNISQGRSNFF